MEFINTPPDYAVMYAMVGCLYVFAWKKIGGIVDNYFGVWQKADCEASKISHDLPEVDIDKIRQKSFREMMRDSQKDTDSHFFGYMRSKCRPIVLSLIDLLKTKSETDWLYFATDKGHKMEICLKNEGGRELLTVVYKVLSDFLPHVVIYGPTPPTEYKPWQANGLYDAERLMFFFHFGDIWSQKASGSGPLKEEIVSAINVLTKNYRQ